MRSRRLSIAAILFAAGPALAQNSSTDVPASSYVDAKIVDRAPPVYPPFAEVDRMEGWVILSFIISPQGEVTEPMIEDSTGIKAFESSAIEALKKWRYMPATRDGVPVEQAVRKFRMAFQIESPGNGATKGARPAFVRQYRDIQKLINERELAKAETLLQALESAERQNLYEDAWLWWLKFTYLKTANSDDLSQERDALRIAIGYEQDYLPPDVMVTAAQELYALEIKGNDFSAARRVFLRLRDSEAARQSKYYEETIGVLRPHFDRVQQVIDGHDTLTVLATIGSHDYWVHDLMRGSFSLSDLKGNIQFLEVRCGRGTKRYESVAADTTWAVPDSWGDCGVYVKGGRGSSFVFQEHPRQSPADSR